MDSQSRNLISQPLLSIVVTLSSLTLLYFPKCIFILILLLIAAATLFLIRTNPFHKMKSTPQFIASDHHIPNPKPYLENGLGSKSQLDTRTTDFDKFDRKSLHVDSFTEWDVSAPLGVIFEESESETEEAINRCYLQRHGSLSRIFPETDTDMSSSDEYPDWDSLDKICFEWEEDVANGLIEIPLDGKKFCDIEAEENLIEIDISRSCPSSL